VLRTREGRDGDVGDRGTVVIHAGETLWSDADDGAAHVLHLQRAIEHVRAAAELRLPELVAEHNDVGAARRTVLGRDEVAA
jgi:hypothetical protein